MGGLEFYTAEEFNEKFLKPSDEPWYRLTNESETHNGFTYQTGVNVNTEEFDPQQDYGGGLYFASKSQIKFWFSYYDKLNLYKRRVLSICPGSSVTVDSCEGQAKTHSYVLGEREDILEGMTPEEIDAILINEKGSHATFYYCMLPLSMRTDRIRDLFVDNSPNGLFQLEIEHRSFTRCSRALQKWGASACRPTTHSYLQIGNAGTDVGTSDDYEMIPDHFWGQGLFEEAINGKTQFPKKFISQLFTSVPIRHRSSALIKLAVHKSSMVVDHLDVEHFTYEFCTFVLKSHPTSFSSLKLNLLSFADVQSLNILAVSL
jgi:hypothetical protein